MRRVITYGTFDLFHQGHYNILKRAKALGDYLVVGVTSESYDIERGKLSVRDDLSTRMKNVKDTGFADEIIIEEYQGQKIRDIQKYQIDVFVIGSDWYGKFENLRKYCEVVYLERTKNISSTIIREHDNSMKIGIATEDLDDGQFVTEAQFVSGYHVQNVYSEDRNTAAAFCEKYGLAEYSCDFENFLAGIQLAYIKVPLRSRYDLIQKALDRGVHIISDSPIADVPEKIQELFALARRKKTLLFENLKTAYLRGFSQLSWMIQSNHIIGDIYNIHCSASGGAQDRKMISYALYMIFKLLGHDYLSIKEEFKNDAYEYMTVKYPEALATVEICPHSKLDEKMEIIGSDGCIVIPDDWWNTRFYKHITNEGDLNRSSFNFEGNGLRYILQEMSITIRNGLCDNPRLSNEESLAIQKAMAEAKAAIHT